MNRNQIIGFLQLIATKPASDQSRTGWVIAHCPFGFWKHDGGDKHPSFGIKIEPGDSFATCFSCAWHGRLSDIVLELGHLNKIQPSGREYQLGVALQQIAQADDESLDLNLDSPDIEAVLFGPKPKPAPFPEDWLQSFPPAWETAMGRDYLLGRAVPEEIAWALDLRCDTGQKRVCSPVRDFTGVLRGLHGRAIDPEDPLRYRMYANKGGTNPIVWLGEYWVDVEQPILVVEGMFDLMSCMRVYRNVVSPLFANPSTEKLKRMGDALQWITLLDNGTGGNRGRQRISQVMQKNLVTHLTPTPGKDPGDMLVGELIHLLEPYLTLDATILA